MKNYNLIQYYKIGYYLDAYDENNYWRLAKITEFIGEDKIKVNLDGWNNNWDEVFKITSSRLAPLRKYTQGYTGSKTYTRKFNLTDKNDINRINMGIERMEETRKSAFHIDDVAQFNQFYRGEIYVLIDSILCMGSIPPQELKLAIDFLETYIRLFIRYIENIKNYLPWYIESHSTHLLNLISPEVAICASYREIFESILKIFSLDERAGQFYLNNEFILIKHTIIYA